MKVAVLFPKIFDFPFTYESKIEETLCPGDFVQAPFGSIELTGVIWPDQQKTEKKFQIKKISKKLNIKGLNKSMIDFITWFSKYNLVPLGMVLKMTFEGLLKDFTRSFEGHFNLFFKGVRRLLERAFEGLSKGLLKGF